MAEVKLEKSRRPSDWKQIGREVTTHSNTNNEGPKGREAELRELEPVTIQTR